MTQCTKQLVHRCLPLLVVVMLACVPMQGVSNRIGESVEEPGPVSGLLFDEAVKLWCDSSVEVMMLSRELRKVDTSDVEGFHRRLMQIVDLLENLSRAKVADEKENVEGQTGRADDDSMPNLEEARRQVGQDQQRYLSRMMQEFREVDASTYLHAVTYLREGPKEKRRSDSAVNPAGPFPAIKPVSHGWIRREWKHKSGLVYFRDNVDLAVQSIPWLKDLMAHLELNLSEMLVFGLDTALGDDVNQARMQKVFGNLKTISAQQFEAAVSEEREKGKEIELNTGSCRRNSNWMDRFQCQVAIGAESMSELVTNIKTLAKKSLNPESSLLSESSNSSDDDDLVGHALSVTSSQHVGSVNSTLGSTLAVGGSNNRAIVSFVQWLIETAIPWLIKWALIAVISYWVLWVVMAALATALPIMLVLFPLVYIVIKVQPGGWSSSLSL